MENYLFYNKEICDLNRIEQYLKSFLEDYPLYRNSVIGLKDDSSEDYDKIYALLKNYWDKRIKDEDFFLDKNTFYIKEDFFLLPQENITMRRNLRYMPLLLHSHQFIEINYIHKSNDSFMITRSGKLELNDGDIILCPPRFEHCFQAHNDKSIILDFFIRVTTFDTVFFQLLNKNNYLSVVFSNAIYNNEGSYILWHCNDDAELTRLVMESYREWSERPKYCEQMLEANMLKFFVMLMRKHENDAVFSVPQVSSTDSIFNTFLNYMHLHCQTVSLTVLAEQFGYSERQVIRILKKQSGKGFSELLQDIRMNKAIHLLKNSSFSISHIARTLGYSNTAYFQKVFFKTFTFTPEAFRESHTKRLSNYSAARDIGTV
ncbi:MAG: AraC family transcriptional regulator [Lachnospiraceae bacterium]|nr:AraC family transcriptional regulator [Lachnospiraceae bacterium]